MMKKSVLFSCLLAFIFSPLPAIDYGHTMQQDQQGVISPGGGVDQYLIGRAVPRGGHCGKANGLEITCDGKGNIMRIGITSHDFFLERSKVRIGDDIGNIFRYYGYGESELTAKGVLIKYPDIGLDFEVDKYKEMITAIIIYRPLSPEFNKEQYRYYQEQLKK